MRRVGFGIAKGERGQGGGLIWEEERYCGVSYRLRWELGGGSWEVGVGRFEIKLSRGWMLPRKIIESNSVDQHSVGRSLRVLVNSVTSL